MAAALDYLFDVAIDDAKLVVLYRAGVTFAQIGEELGCGLFVAYDRVMVLRARGVDLPPRRPRRPRWTEAQRQLLARLRREGVSLRGLEVEFERSRGTITSQLRTLRRLGYDVFRTERPASWDAPSAS